MFSSISVLQCGHINFITFTRLILYYHLPFYDIILHSTYVNCLETNPLPIPKQALQDKITFFLVIVTKIPEENLRDFRHIRYDIDERQYRNVIFSCPQI